MIDAKPTTYAGIKFKSRLEARWAIYLTSLNLHPCYEPVTFRIGTWNYTPDFSLKGSNVPFCAAICSTLLEVKPCRPTDEYLDLLKALEKGTNYQIFIAVGDFFKLEPTIYTPAYTSFQKSSSFLAQRYKLRPGDCKRAFLMASKYRFDLR